MVRGPQSLREDIADEIADHLACHEEDEPAADPAAAHAAAVRAFGNAEQIARELRAIHLGDLIMFQKITIAALVVIVAGMAATAYFSYQSSRQTAAQFAQTALKFDEMNQQLTELVELQRSALPKKQPPPPAPTPAPTQKSAESHVRLRLRCGIAPNDEPAASWTVRVTRNAPPFNSQTYTTDADGWVTTDPLERIQPGYLVMCSEPGPEATDDDGRAGYRHRVHLDADATDSQELRITVASREDREVSIRWPDGISWDRSKMSDARVRFISAEDPGYQSRVQTIDLFKTNRVSGLFPGKAHVWLGLRGVFEDKPGLPGDAGSLKSQEVDNAWYEIAEIAIPESDATIEIPMNLEPAEAITGILYDGTRDKPVSDTDLQLICRASSTHGAVPSYSSSVTGSTRAIHQQYLRTDAQGRFTTWIVRSLPDSTALPVPSGRPVRSSRSRSFYADYVSRIGVPCTDPGGGKKETVWFPAKPPVKVFPLADGSAFMEIDVSQVGTGRVSLSDVEGLSIAGRSADKPIAVSPSMVSEAGRNLSLHQIISGNYNSVSLDNWHRLLECRPNETVDIRLPAGKYVISSSLSLTERDPTRPDVEKRCRYERLSSGKEPVEITPGEVLQIILPIGDLKGWELKHSEWHRAGTTQPATAPAGDSVSGKRR